MHNNAPRSGTVSASFAGIIFCQTRTTKILRMISSSGVFFSFFPPRHMCDTVSDMCVQERVQVLRMDAASARYSGTYTSPHHHHHPNAATWAGAQPGLIIGELWCLVSPGINAVMLPCPASRSLENTCTWAVFHCHASPPNPPHRPPFLNKSLL